VDVLDSRGSKREDAPRKLDERYVVWRLDLEVSEPLFTDILGKLTRVRSKLLGI
jgi:hypothetical protein